MAAVSRSGRRSSGRGGQPRFDRCQSPETGAHCSVIDMRPCRLTGAEAGRMTVTVVRRTEFVTRISSRAWPSPSFPSFLTTWPASAGAASSWRCSSSWRCRSRSMASCFWATSAAVFVAMAVTSPAVALRRAMRMLITAVTTPATPVAAPMIAITRAVTSIPVTSFVHSSAGWCFRGTRTIFDPPQCGLAYAVIRSCLPQKLPVLLRSPDGTRRGSRPPP